MKQVSILLLLIASILTATAGEKPIDRKALMKRNNPVVTSVDTLASLSVGNGGFAFTTDVTGLQTFPEHYRKRCSLGHTERMGLAQLRQP